MDALLSAKPELLISVVGIGGCGCNTINMLNESSFSNSVQLIAVNTDLAVLNHSSVNTKILIGENLTKGYGAGADPAIGLRAAQESEEALRNAIDGSDIVIITAGFGGGTGTGASPLVAKIAKELDINCLAVVTLPFESESKMRMDYALAGINEIKEPVQGYITLSNDLLLTGLGESVGIFSAFKHSNDVLKNLLTSLVQMLTQCGEINVDINDFAKILSYEGQSILGVGKAESEELAFEALDQALNNPLVSNADIATAEGVIIQICCKHEIALSTYESLLKQVQNKLLKEKALVIAGVMLMPELSCDVEVLLIASGITADDSSQVEISKANKEKTKQGDYLGEDLTFVSSEEQYTDIPAIVRQMWASKRDISGFEKGEPG
jgi:cell division protein FtsZ